MQLLLTHITNTSARTTTQTSSPFDSTSSNHTSNYSINSRSINNESNTAIPIRSVSGRLARIAEMADKFNTRRGSIVTTTVNGDRVTVTTPRIVR